MIKTLTGFALPMHLSMQTKNFFFPGENSPYCDSQIIKPPPPPLSPNKILATSPSLNAYLKRTNLTFVHLYIFSQSCKKLRDIQPKREEMHQSHTSQDSQTRRL